MSLSTINYPASEASAKEAHLSSTFGPRLVTLSDGRPGLRGGIHVTATTPGKDAVLSVPDPSAPTVPNPSSTLDFISSDESLDRYGEIITATGWNLENYRRNPVFQNSHQYGDVIFTLGKALITEVREVGRAVPSAPPRLALLQRIEFAVDANPMARIAYSLYKAGFLRTVSVGFIPLRWEDGSKSSSPSIPFRRKYLEQELLEVSAVAIPANPNALALALKSGAVEKADLEDTFDLLRQTLAQPASPPIHQSINPSIHPLLPFARAIRDALKHL